MITSNNNNQYLPPDYLFTPVSSTLDSKKSPLAMLAQTCSQIGADPPNIKSNVNQKSTKKNDIQRDKSSPNSLNCNGSPGVGKATFKPYESCIQTQVEERNGTTDKKTSISKLDAKGSGHKRRDSITSPSSSPGTRKSTNAQDLTINGGRPQSHPASSSPYTSKNADSVSSLKSLSTPNSTLSSYPSSLPLDLMASSLFTHPFKGLHPYANYPSVKSPGNESYTRACRDPYCTSCQLGCHLLGSNATNGKSSCPAGCTQCDVKAASLLAGSHGTAVATAYAQAQLAAFAAATQMPYVCSWVGPGDTSYCGKRFSSSEELLQHLRTHSSDSISSASHSLLSRAYSNSLLNPFTASRYHPYSKPPFYHPSLFPLQPNSSLPPYYPPYFLYGSKS